jgi:uncharacterized protein YndB with AHSA1/START domain
VAVTAGSSALAAPNEPTIVVRRTVDAPRALVWEVWTDPKHIVQWWGPNGFTNTIQSMAVKPGGVWRFVMHGPDGTDFDNRIVYHEVVKPERLVYEHRGEDNSEVDPHRFHVTVLFTEKGNQTEIVMCSTFPSVEARNAVMKFNAVEGGKQTLDKMALYLAHHPNRPTPLIGRRLIMHRSFAAPRELVFKMWTEEKHMAAWWGPRHFTAPECKLDARPGGKLAIRMTGLGFDDPLEGTFIEVDPPHRLVFTAMAMADESGKHQLQNRNTVTFAEHNGVTTLTLEVVVEYATPAMAPALGGMEQGWRESLDKLVEAVALEMGKIR